MSSETSHEVKISGWEQIFVTKFKVGKEEHHQQHGFKVRTGDYDASHHPQKSEFQSSWLGLPEISRS